MRQWLTGLALVALGLALAVPAARGQGGLVQPPSWAFQATFDGTPTAPSQDLLPRTFEYAMTVRAHATEAGVGTDDAPVSGTYPADHGMDCSPPPAQHPVQSHGGSNSAHPDPAFYICRNHMMSSAGVIGDTYYDTTDFWPKQEFDFSQGVGVLEFDVDLASKGNENFWFDVNLMPRQEFQIAPSWYTGTWEGDHFPQHYINLHLGGHDVRRSILVGANGPAPGGIVQQDREPYGWAQRYPTDPANTDAGIRRRHHIEVSDQAIRWSILTQDGVTFDTYTLPLTQPLPFHRALVDFSTHNAFTASSTQLTYHWDTIRFSGPVLPPYENVVIPGNPDFETISVLFGPPPVGYTLDQPFTLDHLGPNPQLVGQTHNATVGQPKYQINGGPVHDVTWVALPPDLACFTTGHHQFRLPINPSELRLGANTITWIMGPTQDCGTTRWWSPTYAVRHVTVEFDGTVAPTPVPAGTSTPTTGPLGTSTRPPFGTATSTPPAGTTVTPTSSATLTATLAPPTSTRVTPTSTPSVAATAPPTRTPEVPPTLLPTATVGAAPTLVPTRSPLPAATATPLPAASLPPPDPSRPCQVPVARFGVVTWNDMPTSQCR